MDTCTSPGRKVGSLSGSEVLVDIDKSLCQMRLWEKLSKRRGKVDALDWGWGGGQVMRCGGFERKGCGSGW